LSAPTGICHRKFAIQEQAGRWLKKTTADLESARQVIAGRHSKQPDHWFEVDAQNQSKTC
jgi:hypothetical protein